MSDQTCSGTTKNGQPCRSTFLVSGSDRCAAHAPNGSEVMAARGRKGAAASRTRMEGAGLPSGTLGDLNAQRWLKLIAQAVGDRNLTHSEGQAMTAAVREWVKAEGDRLKEGDLEYVKDTVSRIKVAASGGKRRAS